MHAVPFLSFVEEKILYRRLGLARSRLQIAFFELTLLFSVSPSHLAPYFVTSKICCPAWGVTMQRSSHAVAAALRGHMVGEKDG